MGKYAGYKHIVSGAIIGIVSFALAYHLFTDKHGVADYIILISMLCCSSLFLLMNIKFLQEALKHVTELYIDRDQGILGIYNAFAKKNEYPLSSILIVNQIGAKDGFLKNVSYLSMDEQNIEIILSDGKHYFMNGAAKKAKKVFFVLEELTGVGDGENHNNNTSGSVLKV